MTPSPQQTLSKALRLLMRPMVRILLRHGMAFSEFAEIARTVYIEVAHAEFPPAGRKQTLSNVAVLTGVHRHDVKKVLTHPGDEPVMAPQQNRAVRVINGWLTDPEFSDDGEARLLSIEPEFHQLVARYSGDITPRPILDELLRVGAVARDGKQLQLLTRTYVPHASDQEMLQIFGECVYDLVGTVEHNLTHVSAEQRLQISVVHDNLPNEVMRHVELVSRDKAMAFLTDLNQFMTTQDRDGNAKLEGSGCNRAGMGVYFFRNTVETDTDSPTK